MCNKPLVIHHMVNKHKKSSCVGGGSSLKRWFYLGHGMALRYFRLVEIAKFFLQALVNMIDTFNIGKYDVHYITNNSESTW